MYKLLFNSFQACNQLEIATYVEERSIRIRRDALQTLKVGLARTRVCHFLVPVCSRTRVRDLRTHTLVPTFLVLHLRAKVGQLQHLKPTCTDF